MSNCIAVIQVNTPVNISDITLSALLRPPKLFRLRQLGYFINLNNYLTWSMFLTSSTSPFQSVIFDFLPIPDFNSLTLQLPLAIKYKAVTSRFIVVF
jgi:hypothetical protein